MARALLPVCVGEIPHRGSRPGVSLVRDRTPEPRVRLGSLTHQEPVARDLCADSRSAARTGLRHLALREGAAAGSRHQRLRPLKSALEVELARRAAYAAAMRSY